jgi:ABC-type polysaccharide/polyol phosphate transport system ATPase subunit
MSAILLEKHKFSEPKIILEKLGKQFESRKSVITAVQDVSLDIKKGEFVCIVGPSLKNLLKDVLPFVMTIYQNH